MFLLPPCRHHAAMCPAEPQVQRVLFSPLPRRSCPLLSCHCPSATSCFLPDLHLCHLCLEILFRSNFAPFQNFIVLCLFLCFRLATREPRFGVLLPNSRHRLLAAIPISIGGLVSIFLFLADCCNLVEDGDLQRKEMLIVRHRRSTESEVPQALNRQFLDFAHLFLISDCAESVLKFVLLIDETSSGRRRVAQRLGLCLAQRCC